MVMTRTRRSSARVPLTSSPVSPRSPPVNMNAPARSLRSPPVNMTAPATPTNTNDPIIPGETIAEEIPHAPNTTDHIIETFVRSISNRLIGDPPSVRVDWIIDQAQRNIPLERAVRLPSDHPYWPGEAASKLNLSWVPNLRPAKLDVRITVPQYKKGDCVQEWWTQMRQAARTLGWSAPSIILVARLYAFKWSPNITQLLVALEKSNSLPETLTDFLILLERHFDAGSRLQESFKEWLALSQREGEGSTGFYNRLQILAQRIESHGDSFSVKLDASVRNYRWLIGLRPGLQRHLLNIKTQTEKMEKRRDLPHAPIAIETFLELAVQYEDQNRDSLQTVSNVSKSTNGTPNSEHAPRRSILKKGKKKRWGGRNFKWQRKNMGGQTGTEPMTSRTKSVKWSPDTFCGSISSRSDNTVEVYLDSGASESISYQRDRFTYLETCDTSLEDASGNPMPVVARGPFQVTRGLVIPDVLFVPSAARNLLSVARLEEQGFSVDFPNCQLKLKDGPSWPIKNHSGLKAIDLPGSVNGIAVGSLIKGHVNSDTERHCILCHYNQKGCRAVSTQQCLPCGFSKLTVRTVAKEAAKGSDASLWYCDILVGPAKAKVPTRYLLGFVHRGTGVIAVYPLTKKSNASDQLAQFLLDFSGHVSALQTDSENVLKGGEFARLTRAAGLPLRRSPVATPQHNGRIERAWRTLKEAVASMSGVWGNDVGTHFWSYAVMHAAYVKNRIVLASSTHTKPPLEQLTGISYQRDLDNLAIFGCLASIRTAISPSSYQSRGQAALYLGNSRNTSPGTAVFYNMETRRVVESRSFQTFNSLSMSYVAPDTVEYHALEDPHLFNPTSFNTRALSNCFRPQITGLISELPETMDVDDTQVATETDHSLEPSTFTDEPMDLDTVAGADPSPPADIQQSPHHEPASSNGRIQDPEISTFRENSPDGNLDISIPENQNLISPAVTSHGAAEKRSFSMERDTQNQRNITVEPRRSKRIKERSANNIMASVPTSYKDIIGRPDEKKWKQAIAKEFNSFENQCVYRVLSKKEVKSLPRAEINKIIDTTKVFKIKSDGTYKARIVARGFKQQPSQIPEVLYSPTVRFPHVLLLNALLKYTHEMSSTDVLTAYLNAHLSENVLMYGPEGTPVAGKILKVMKSIYGLRQSGANWYDMLNNLVTTIEGYNFVQTKVSPCIWICNNTKVVIAAYVDDLQIFIPKPDDSKRKLRDVWSKLCKLLVQRSKNKANTDPMKFPEEMGEFIGAKWKHTTSEWVVSMQKKIDKVIFDSNLKDNSNIFQKTPYLTPSQKGHIQNGSTPLDAEGIKKYQQLVGQLLYIALNSRPDIHHAVWLRTRKGAKPTKYDATAVYPIIRYLSHNKHWEIGFRKSDPESTIISVYSDSGLSPEDEDTGSTMGMIVSVNDDPIYWKSSKHKLVQTNSTESELRALVQAIYKAQETLMFIRDLSGLLNEKRINIEVKTDGLNAIHTMKKLALRRNARMNLDYIQQILQNNAIDIKHIERKDNIADMMTKEQPYDDFARQRKRMMIRTPSESSWIIVDLCGGLGTSYLAAMKAGIAVKYYHCIDICKLLHTSQLHQSFPLTPKNHGAKKRYHQSLDITTDHDRLQQILHHISATRKNHKVILVVGWPCQDLSGLNASGKGLKGFNSRIFYDAVSFRDMLQPDAEVWENVPFNKLHPRDFNEVNNKIGTIPIAINANLFTPQNRRRFFWIKGFRVYQINEKDTCKTSLQDLLESIHPGKYQTNNKYASCVVASRESRADQKVYDKQTQEVTRLPIDILCALQGFPDISPVFPDPYLAKKFIGNAIHLSVLTYIFSYL